MPAARRRLFRLSVPLCCCEWVNRGVNVQCGEEGPPLRGRWGWQCAVWRPAAARCRRAGWRGRRGAVLAGGQLLGTRRPRPRAPEFRARAARARGTEGVAGPSARPGALLEPVLPVCRACAAGAGGTGRIFRLRARRVAAVARRMPAGERVPPCSAAKAVRAACSARGSRRLCRGTMLCRLNAAARCAEGSPHCVPWPGAGRRHQAEPGGTRRRAELDARSRPPWRANEPAGRSRWQGVNHAPREKLPKRASE